MRELFFKILLLVLSVIPLGLSAQDEQPIITLVDEDFSGLIAGTEHEPASDCLVDGMGWLKNKSAWKPVHESCTQGWGGDQLYSAGGCLAIINGFLNTPTGDYSGNLKASFRMRLMDQEELTTAPLDLLLCRRSVFVDFARKTVNLTHEWQTFTLETENGSSADCMIQLFSMDDIQFLVDDIKIEHQIKTIDAPKPTLPYDLVDDGFTAYWEGVDKADEYLLSVYSKTANPDAAHWNLGEQALLKKNGDCVLTPKSDVALGECSINARIEDNGQIGKATGFLNVYALTDHGWFLWVYFSVESSRGVAGGETDLTPAMGAFDNIYQLRVEYENPNIDRCYVVIDDIKTYAPGTFTKNFVFEDKLMEGGKGARQYEVRGLDPDVDYFYYLRARNSEFTSAPSKEMEVFDVSDPVALPATEVTKDGYVANWDCHKKVDIFRIEQLRQLTVEEDNPQYVILDEGFDGVHSEYGTAETPEMGEYTTDYYPIDNLTSTGGWIASSPQYAEGMIGGMAKETGYIAGCIGTPQLDLSHNGGQCDVTIRVWGYEGDWLVIQGNNTLNYAGINFETTGWVETTIQMPLCGNEERLYFYSNNYNPFMIDYIRITQNLKAGEVITLVDKSATADAEARSIQMENVNFGGKDSDILYRVEAHRYYHGNKSDVWKSPYSEYISVRSSDTGMKYIVNDANGAVYDIMGRKRNADFRGMQIVNRDGKYVKIIR